jgi:hypothetical protein
VTQSTAEENDDPRYLLFNEIGMPRAISKVKIDTSWRKPRRPRRRHE